MDFDFSHRLYEFYHGLAPSVPIVAIIATYLPYSLGVKWFVRKEGGDPYELGLLIPITYAVLILPLLFLLYKGFINAE